MSNDLKRLREAVGSQSQISKALSVSTEHVSRMATGKLPVPAYITALAELLEALPRKEWPDRWSKK